jgi:hypothetical protein
LGYFIQFLLVLFACRDVSVKVADFECQVNLLQESLFLIKQPRKKKV